MFGILESRVLAPGVTRFEVEAPLVARKRQAGQFVIVRVAATGERIPLTIVDADPARGSITLVVQAVGRTTRLLSSLGAGDSLLDVVGPLGNPTPLVGRCHVACVGGGVGAAELLPIARALRSAGSRVHAILGARSGSLLVLEPEMRSVADDMAVATEDGSRGRRGLVTDVLREWLAERREAATGRPIFGAVYAIGPPAMMKAVAELTRPHALRTYVSLNAIMVDGTGMCGGCRVSVGGAMRFACVDGPEFDGHAVDFDELIRRNSGYTDMERLADERHRAELA